MGHRIANCILLLILGVSPCILGAGSASGASTAPAPQPQPVDEMPVLDSAGHLIAEGDYLLAQFYDGQEQQEYYLQVDSAGEVCMPLVNTVAIGGLTPREASEMLTAEYSKYYHNPYVALQILKLGKFEIFVFGPDFPGKIHTVANGTRFLDVFNDNTIFHDTAKENVGRYRRIHLIRGDFEIANLAQLAGSTPALQTTSAQALNLPSPGAVTRTDTTLAGMTNWRAWIQDRQQDSQIWTIDPLSLTVEGELSRYNIQLKRNDVIYIPTAERFVEIRGVANPGRYELLEEQTLGEVLRLAGSISYSADLINTVVTRFDECGNVERLVFNLFPAIDQPYLIENFELQHGDVINLVPREQRIFVLGEVNVPGAFEFVEDSTVLDYLALAGGETPRAHLAWIAIIRQGRNRLDQLNQAEVIHANFKEIHKGLPLCTDISLLPGDVIYVPPKGAQFELSHILQAISTTVTTFAVLDSAGNGSS